MIGMGPPALAALEDIVRRAGTIALDYRGRVTPQHKADRTLVTEADRAVEDFLVSALADVFPEAAILGEEGTSRAGSGSHCIVIDPIDGTSAFLADLPTWCVSVGILDHGRAIAGVVHVPCTNETYAASGTAARLNGRTMLPLIERVIPAEPYIAVPAKLHLQQRLRYPGKARALGSAAHHLALVARGSADAALLEPAYLWDIAGAAAILEAVGGALRYADGAAVDLQTLADGRRAPNDIVAAPASRIEEFLALFRRGA